jgi:hypothetical protein
MILLIKSFKVTVVLIILLFNLVIGLVFEATSVELQSGLEVDLGLALLPRLLRSLVLALQWLQHSQFLLFVVLLNYLVVLNVVVDVQSHVLVVYLVTLITTTVLVCIHHNIPFLDSPFLYPDS